MTESKQLQQVRKSPSVLALRKKAWASVLQDGSCHDGVRLLLNVNLQTQMCVSLTKLKLRYFQASLQPPGPAKNTGILGRAKKLERPPPWSSVLASHGGRALCPSGWMRSWAPSPLCRLDAQVHWPRMGATKPGPSHIAQGSAALLSPSYGPGPPGQRPLLPPSVSLPLLALASLLSDFLSLHPPRKWSSCHLSGPTPQNLRSCLDFHAESEIKTSSD